MLLVMLLIVSPPPTQTPLSAVQTKESLTKTPETFSKIELAPNLEGAINIGITPLVPTPSNPANTIKPPLTTKIPNKTIVLNL
jgi:hypothetical protein